MLDSLHPASRARLLRALGSVEVRTGPDGAMAWWADGELHLGPAAMAVPEVVALVGAAGGAVYVDGAGRVVRIDPSGERLLLGFAGPAPSLVSSPAGGLVAWMDTSGTRHTVTVVDAVDGTRRRTLPLATGDMVRPVSVRSDRVYLADETRSTAWLFDREGVRGRPAISWLGEPGLLAVGQELAAFGPDPTDPAAAGSVRITTLDLLDRHPAPGTWVDLPGAEVALPASGTLVLTRGVGGTVGLRDLGSGRDLPTGLGDGEVALAADIGPYDQLAYLVGSTTGTDSMPLIAR